MGDYNYALNNPDIFNKKVRLKRGEQILKILQQKIGKNKLKQLKVLDLGASSGIITDYLTPNFKSVTGIDIDKSAIPKRKNFLFMAATDLKFPQNSFDIVIAHQIHFYIKDQEKLFKEIFRVLRPGGICFLAGVNKYWPFKRDQHVPTYYKSYWELESLCQEFNIEKITPRIAKARTGYFLPLWLLKPFEPFYPNFIWLLKKD